MCNINTIVFCYTKNEEKKNHNKKKKKSEMLFFVIYSISIYKWREGEKQSESVIKSLVFKITIEKGRQCEREIKIEREKKKLIELVCLQLKNQLKNKINKLIVLWKSYALNNWQLFWQVNNSIR